MQYAHACVQVAQRAGEIAKELGLISQAVQSDASQNATGTWMNLNLFNRNGSDGRNSSWYSSDESVKPSGLDVQAALQKYQQLEMDESEVSLGPSSALPAGEAVRKDSGWLQEDNVPEFLQTNSQSRAERAGSKHHPV